MIFCRYQQQQKHEHKTKQKKTQENYQDHRQQQNTATTTTTATKSGSFMIKKTENDNISVYLRSPHSDIYRINNSFSNQNTISLRRKKSFLRKIES